MFFVEYKLKDGDSGYCPSDKAIGIVHMHRKLNFRANPVHAGRRIEEFELEADAQKIVERFPRMFGFAHDLLTEREQNGIDARIEAAIAPLIARMDAMEKKCQCGSSKSPASKKAK